MQGFSFDSLLELTHKAQIYTHIMPVLMYNIINTLYQSIRVQTDAACMLFAFKFEHIAPTDTHEAVFWAVL